MKRRKKLLEPNKTIVYNSIDLYFIKQGGASSCGGNLVRLRFHWKLWLLITESPAFMRGEYVNIRNVSKDVYEVLEITRFTDLMNIQKILQIMFLAIFFGVVINRMGEKARGATECLDFLFQFTVVALKFIIIPPQTAG